MRYSITDISKPSMDMRYGRIKPSRDMRYSLTDVYKTIKRN